MNGTEIKLQKANFEDLKEHKVSLDKAVTGLDFQRVIKILKYLQKVQMTKETLAATLIGKSVNPLTVFKTPAERGDLEQEAAEIREISGVLLAEWKKLLVKPSETPSLTKQPSIPTPETPKLSTHSSLETSLSKMEESKVKALVLPEGK